MAINRHRWVNWFLLSRLGRLKVAFCRIARSALSWIASSNVKSSACRLLDCSLCSLSKHRCFAFLSSHFLGVSLGVLRIKAVVLSLDVNYSWCDFGYPSVAGLVWQGIEAWSKDFLMGKRQNLVFVLVQHHQEWGVRQRYRLDVLGEISHLLEFLAGLRSL